VLGHAGGADEGLAVVLVFAALWVGWIGWSRLRRQGFPRVPRGAAIGLLVLAGALGVASAIVPRAIFPGPGSGPRPASTASLSFLAPTGQQRESGGQMSVALDLEGGTITDATGTSLAPDEGHIHLSLDGRLVSMTSSTTTVIDIVDLTPGQHTLEAEFVAADHGPFSPRVVTWVTFTKAAGR
jgi:hypothetical protein